MILSACRFVRRSGLFVALSLSSTLLFVPSARAAAPGGLAAALSAELDRQLVAGQAQLLENRHHLHAHPELGNRETETAAYLAARLRATALSSAGGT